jgi:hypothetical protein
VTPEYLNELADLADPEQLWTLPGLSHLELPPGKRRQLDMGVALRRYAAHVRDVQALLGTGRSWLITPLSPNGTARCAVETPDKHRRLVEARAAASQGDRGKT